MAQNYTWMHVVRGSVDGDGCSVSLSVAARMALIFAVPASEDHAENVFGVITPSSRNAVQYYMEAVLDLATYRRGTTLGLSVRARLVVSTCLNDRSYSTEDLRWIAYDISADNIH